MLNHLHGKPRESQPAGSMAGWGKTYDTLVGFLSMGHESKLRQATLDLAQIKPGEAVLEVGCGTGTLTLKARAASGQQSMIAGIDIAPDMIEAANDKAAKAGLTVNYQVGRIQEIPFPDQTFDIVLSSLMMHHVPGSAAKQAGIKEVFRVLKPGGRLLIVDIARPENPHIRGIASLIVGKEMLKHNVTEFIPLLDNAGFSDIETGPTSFSFLAYLNGKRPQIKFLS